MRELLIQLERELEACRRPLRPGTRNLGARLTVKRRVHLDGVEMFRVEAQLVEVPGLRLFRARRRVEQPVPGAFTGWVIPARCTYFYSHTVHRSLFYLLSS